MVGTSVFVCVDVAGGINGDSGPLLIWTMLACKLCQRGELARAGINSPSAPASEIKNISRTITVVIRRWRVFQSSGSVAGTFFPLANWR